MHRRPVFRYGDALSTEGFGPSLGPMDLGLRRGLDLLMGSLGSHRWVPHWVRQATGARGPAGPGRPPDSALRPWTGAIAATAANAPLMGLRSCSGRQNERPAAWTSCGSGDASAGWAMAVSPRQEGPLLSMFDVGGFGQGWPRRPC